MDLAFDAFPAWVLPVLVVLVAVQIGVEIYALVRLFKTPDERLVFGTKLPWVFIILFVNLVGAIMFLVAGTKPTPTVDPLSAGQHPMTPTLPADRSAVASHTADVLYGNGEGE